MDSPTSIRCKHRQPPEILSPCGSQRRRSSCDSNPPEFEFWRLANSSFHQSDSDLLSADELFHDGVLLPLHLLSVKPESQPDPNTLECEPDPSPSPASLIREQKTEPETGLGSELTRETTVSKRWRDIFRKNETKSTGKKEKVKENKKKEKKTGSGLDSGSGSGAELNINIWPFSRSRSAGNNVIRPRMSFGAPTTRKVSSAPCSRSNSTGESKSRKWPSSPGRNGVHLGRSSPVWQVRRGGGAPAGKTMPEPMGRAVGKREIPKTCKGKTVIESNKAKVINLNVPICIGYRSRLSCRTDESGNSNNIGSDDHNANANNPNPNGLFGFRNLFIKKVH